METLLLSLLTAAVFFLKALLFFATAFLVGVGLLTFLVFGITLGYATYEFFRS